MRAHISRHREMAGLGRGKHMKRSATRRGVRALVLVGAIVGVVTAGLATQASATPPITAHVVGGFGQSVNPNSKIDAPVTEFVESGHTLVVSVATGTFNGSVECHDKTGVNPYTVVADRNTGNGRLFVCVGHVLAPLGVGDLVTATYPGFSGVSAISVVEFDGALSADSDDASTGFGSNPPVNSGSLCLDGGYLLFGVAANTNVSTFDADSPWLDLTPTQSGGGGAAKRTLTPEWQPFQFGGCSNKALTGHLSGSGFWQAAIIALYNPA
jgi:hypothetical protein